LAVKQPYTQHRRTFPYKALNPVLNESVEIKTIEQVYEILMQCYDEAVEGKFNIGESLYSQLFFFVDPEELYSSEYQNLIKKYLFCDTFKCPPYPSLQETPAEMVDDFLLIKREIAIASKEN